MDILKYTSFTHNNNCVLESIVKWFKSQGCWDLYCNNLDTQHPNLDLKAFVKKTGGYNLINRTLVWAHTIEGSDFWTKWSAAYDRWWNRKYEIG